MTHFIIICRAGMLGHDHGHTAQRTENQPGAHQEKKSRPGQTEHIPDDLFCFHNELSRVREKKQHLQLDVATATSTGSVDTSTAVFD